MEVDMRTITAAARELRVGKTRLYSLLTETGVEPFQQGKSRMIDDAQLQILQNAIHPALDLKDDPERPTGLTGRPEEREKRSSGPSESSTERSEPYKELVQRMSSEIDHLRELLTSERADRQKREDEVSTERQNYQQMLMLMDSLILLTIVLIPLVNPIKTKTAVQMVMETVGLTLVMISLMMEHSGQIPIMMDMETTLSLIHI